MGACSSRLRGSTQTSTNNLIWIMPTEGTHNRLSNFCKFEAEWKTGWFFALLFSRIKEAFRWSGMLRRGASAKSHTLL